MKLVLSCVFILLVNKLNADSFKSSEHNQLKQHDGNLSENRHESKEMDDLAEVNKEKLRKLIELTDMLSPREMSNDKRFRYDKRYRYDKRSEPTEKRFRYDKRSESMEKRFRYDKRFDPMQKRFRYDKRYRYDKREPSDEENLIDDLKTIYKRYRYD